MAIPRIRAGNYPAILSYVFRPFFLLGALYSGAIMLLWLPVFTGDLSTASAFGPIDWHAHEMLYGYLAAIAGAFILMSVPNWTGRLPLQGLPLFLLVVLWIAGRVAVFLSSDIGWLAGMLIDSAFLVAVAATVGLELRAGKNWRNLKVLIPLLVLIGANIVIHVEAARTGTAPHGERLAIGATIVLITIVGGRIVPSFTQNWLIKNNRGRLPASFSAYDAGTIGASALAMLSWTMRPEGTATGTLLLLAGLLNLVRMARWAGDRSLRASIVLILHLAYLFLPAGFFLSGLGALWPDIFPYAAGVHAFGAGAIGVMTLGVMTRISLRHTAHAVVAGVPTTLLYAAVILSATLRVAASFAGNSLILLWVSALLWSAAFLGYAALYGKKLSRPRRGRGRPTKRRTSAPEA